MEPSHRSIVPTIPGVPWWAAVLIATGAAAVGYVIDAGHKDLTHVFAGFYIAGCVAAVLAVRQAGVFTAVIQPPLILFCAVPGAFWLFHDGKVDKFKDLLINCGYPLIERFPLMLGTAGGVLLIGLIRWWVGKVSGTAPATEGRAAKKDSSDAAHPSFVSGIMTKLSSLLSGEADAAEADTAAPRAHAKGRPARTARTARSGSRTEQRPSRSRHARPDENEPGERPRRTARRSSVPAGDPADSNPPRRSSRRPRPQDDSDRTRDSRRERTAHRNPYEWPHERERSEPRSSRFDSYETYDSPERPGRGERNPRRERRGGGYDNYEPYEPPPRRAAPSGSNNSNPTHHPISQVRYRGQGSRDDRREPYPDERSDRPGRSRSPRRPQTESWEYDS